MKKPLIAYLIVFVLAFAAFAFMGMEKVNNNAAIAKAPSFMVATPDGITEKTKKGSHTFQINYSYAVAGTTYKIDTEWMDTKAEAMALAGTDVQVAYATDKPSIALFKSDFDKRDPKESILGALLMAAGMALAASLVITLVLYWKFDWLRRP